MDMNNENVQHFNLGNPSRRERQVSFDGSVKHYPETGQYVWHLRRRFREQKHTIQTGTCESFDDGHAKLKEAVRYWVAKHGEDPGTPREIRSLSRI